MDDLLKSTAGQESYQCSFCFRRHKTKIREAIAALHASCEISSILCLSFPITVHACIHYERRLGLSSSTLPNTRKLLSTRMTTLSTCCSSSVFFIPFTFAAAKCNQEGTVRLELSVVKSLCQCLSDCTGNCVESSEVSKCLKLQHYFLMRRNTLEWRDV